MSIYAKVETVIDKYYDVKRDIIERTREDEEGNIHYIDEEIENLLDDEEVYDADVDMLEAFDCPSMTVYSLAWCGCIEGKIYRDHFLVYSM